MDKICTSGVVPYLHRVLQLDDYPQLQFESTWALTNMTSSTSNTVVCFVAEFPGMVHELGRLVVFGKTADLRFQSAWCIGNIAAEASKYRDGLLEMDSVRNGFVHNIISPETKTLLGHFVWALSNILRESSHRDIMETKCFVRPLVRLLEESSRDEVQLRMDVCYCLQYLAEGNVEDGSRPQVLIDFKVLPALKKVLQEEVTSKCPTPKLLVPLTRCFGMIASGNAMQTDLLLSTGILDFIVPLIHVKNKAVLKETMWLLSNIAGGTKDQAEALAKRSRILREVVKASHSDNWATRKEGLWTLCNLLSNNSPTQTRAVVSAGAILPFCASLQISESDLLVSILDSLYTMLVYDANQPNNNMPTVIEEEGALDTIEALLNHRNDQVYEKAMKIIEDHFGTEPDLAEEDPNAGPKLNADSTFAFGLSPSAKNLFPVDGHQFF